jgi:hypothetical protein
VSDGLAIALSDTRLIPLELAALEYPKRGTIQKARRNVVRSPQIMIALVPLKNVFDRNPGLLTTDKNSTYDAIPTMADAATTTWVNVVIAKNRIKPMNHHRLLELSEFSAMFDIKRSKQSNTRGRIATATVVAR